MLTSRPLLEKEELRILIDTEAFDSFLSAGNGRARAILACAAEYSFIRLLRTPGEPGCKELKDIAPFSEKTDSEGNLLAIEMADDNWHRSVAFGYRMQDIESVTKHLSGEQTVSLDKKRQMTLACACACLTGAGYVDLLVTDKVLLLENRLWLESKYPGSPLSIVTVDEAGEILDLFLKSRGIYHVPGFFENTAWHHYLISFLSKVPHFYSGDPIVDALAKRFTFILMCLDRIGCEHYSGTNHSVMASTEYHFYYLLSLMTGVFDSLAIRTDSQFELGFGRTPHKVSLDPNPGKDFLKAIRDGEDPLPDLRQHIQQHVYFIKLVYALRHMVIHREMLQPVTFRMRDKAEAWEMNLLGPIEPAITHLAQQCGDGPEQSGSFSTWGLLRRPSQQDLDCYLLPFQFARTAVQTLITFTNQYLQILGFTNFAEGSGSEDNTGAFADSLRLFDDQRLGL